MEKEKVRGNNTPQSGTEILYNFVKNDNEYTVSITTKFWLFLLERYNKELVKIQDLFALLLLDIYPNNKNIRDYKEDEFLTAYTEAGTNLRDFIWKKITESISDNISAQTKEL